jgi:hypothetical protein
MKGYELIERGRTKYTTHTKGQNKEEEKITTKQKFPHYITSSKTQ